MIWIIGGTSETVQLLNYIEGKVKYIVTVATYCGKEALDFPNVQVQKLDYQGMIDFIKKNGIRQVVDVSHPYAFDVTRNAKQAAKTCSVSYIRYVRKKSVIQSGTYFWSPKDCAAFIKGIKGTVFFTTGIKYIPLFENVKGDNRFVYRVLPSVFSLEACIKYNLKMEDIVCILGPVSRELNEVMFKEFEADYVVMKDSGVEGGTPEKLKACKNTGIIPLMIGRKDEDGMEDIREIAGLLVRL